MNTAVASSHDLSVEISVDSTKTPQWFEQALVMPAKRVFSIDIEVCGLCGGFGRAIACIEDQDVIDRILAHLESKEQNPPTLPHMAPPNRASPERVSLFAGSESTTPNQQGRY